MIGTSRTGRKKMAVMGYGCYRRPSRFTACLGDARARRVNFELCLSCYQRGNERDLLREPKTFAQRLHLKNSLCELLYGEYEKIL